MRKTKIVCTIGPASEDRALIEKLIFAGMNVARLNFSHGTHDEHAARIDLIRACAEEADLPVAIMLDTKGPEIRTGLLKDGFITLFKGDEFTLTSREIEGTKDKVSITYRNLPDDVDYGTKILLDDGLIELEVQNAQNGDVHCRVINGGVLKERKGVNVPGISLNIPNLTEKDIRDITFGIEKEVDFIAVSFVRKAQDVLDIRSVLDKYGSQISIISKIENKEGVNNLEEILAVSDGIMVARGDLGVEIPVEEVPLIQKIIIEGCNKLGKPVITATQMLDSMQNNPRPTRAEATDVANAILDGTDAIMLSGETAAGKYPAESVETMDRIARKAESMLKNFNREPTQEKSTIIDAMGHVVSTAVSSLKAKAILIPTESGHIATAIAKYRPSCPIIALTPYKSVVNQLSLVWGLYPIPFESSIQMDEMINSVTELATRKKIINNGDTIIVIAGVPLLDSGTTNFMQIHVVKR